MITTLDKPSISSLESLSFQVKESWASIAPFWPLKHLVAVNPLGGLVDLPFEEALKLGQAYFQQDGLPEPMMEVNRQTIKWLQVYFDEGQSTLRLPLQKQGLLPSMIQLLPHDNSLLQPKRGKKDWWKDLPQEPLALIQYCLDELGVEAGKEKSFLTLLLSTLPGWSAYIQYRSNWAGNDGFTQQPEGLTTEYLAVRLLLTCLLWPDAKQLLQWHEQALANATVDGYLQQLEGAEKDFRLGLCSALQQNGEARKQIPDAQLVFCIDVRSEPFRRAIEQQGQYETFGMAGFFGIPIAIRNGLSGSLHASCPVLLKPSHTVLERPAGPLMQARVNYQRKQRWRSLYQSLKHNFATPFALVETLGWFMGASMAWRNFFAARNIQSKPSVKADHHPVPNIASIPFDQQLVYGENALRAIGLTKDFAPLVVWCGHGSTTRNNAFASALDCGACGGHEGAPNARILAAILNQQAIRDGLREKGIDIPATTHFLAGQHNTTTDELQLFAAGIPAGLRQKLVQLQADLQKARQVNSLWRSVKLGKETDRDLAVSHVTARANDWAEVRPEWGLSRNAAFIVAPRSLSLQADLDGRCFLHSYDWQQDPDGAILSGILTAPMVVGHWINAQYLFSTLDNVAFGSGSKVTMNVVGKIGVMQGNASDLMHGLPLQSVYKNDAEAYHQPLRLTTVVVAPTQQVGAIIAKHPILQTLFGNEWVKLLVKDPLTNRFYELGADLEWYPVQA
ncbi:DUF2309 domain-containing protein [Flavihumibacter rivuli]|uniref:DUF2309 domain-containing protein n=1 Tax=Flavihumibacter rivuli TaxID=2838156 RepID=UPI001BDE0EC7|nr:DUF2309 domain-containing protein [Flavihumibacter rivuli]ULQ55884.1 DUF2309 domain-containing protein [Flavihumibacter rivuli]